MGCSNLYENENLKKINNASLLKVLLERMMKLTWIKQIQIVIELSFPWLRSIASVSLYDSWHNVDKRQRAGQYLTMLTTNIVELNSLYPTHVSDPINYIYIDSQGFSYFVLITNETAINNLRSK